MRMGRRQRGERVTGETPFFKLNAASTLLQLLIKKEMLLGYRDILPEFFPCTHEQKSDDTNKEEDKD